MVEEMIAKILNADSGVMKEILQFEKDIVIRAGAGTGKTTALVSKYVGELTKKGEDGYIKVDQLLAITFTDKAAAEMKQRVREKLKELIALLESTSVIKASSANLVDDDPSWKEREKLLAHLIRQRQALEGAYISTIHSFCARLLRENPIIAGVDPNFSVMPEEETKALMESVAGKAILKKLKAKDEGVRTLLINEGFDSFGDKKPGLKKRVAGIIPLVRAADCTPYGIEQDFDTRLKSLAEGVAPAQKELRTLLPQMKAQRKGTKIYGLAEQIENDSSLFFENDITLAQSMELMRLSKRVAPKDDLKNEELKDISRKASSLLLKIGGSVFENEMKWVTRSFIALLDETLERYRSEKNNLSSLDYDDLQEKARDLLKLNRATRKIYKTKFRKTLVDEFQDINELQYGIIHLLAEPGEGKLFIVGDIKQSIYGFRGAQVALFGRVGRQIISAGGKEFTLQTNRRSAPPIINFTNQLFRSLMSGDGGSDFKFDIAKDTLEAHRSGEGIDSVVIRKTPDGDFPVADLRMKEGLGIAGSLLGEVASRKIIVEGESGHRPLEYRDVVILLRTFTSLKVYENALRITGVPFHVVRGRGFYHSEEIMDFINLLSFLDYSRDLLSLASILRSPLVGVDDDTLIRLFRDDNGNLLNPVSFIMGGAPLPQEISEVDRERIELFKTRVTLWKRSRDRMFISELLESALSETGYGAVMISRAQGDQQVANLFKLIEIARDYESAGGRGLKNFVSMLKKMVDQAPTEAQADVTGGDDNVVSLMTTHQSKGLEFPVVILGDLGAKMHQSSDAILFHPKRGMGMKHIDKTSGIKIAGPIYTEVIEAQKTAETEELQRLLYVGVTRARDRLILSGSQTKGKGVWQKWIDTAIKDEHLEVRLEGCDQPNATRNENLIKENSAQVTRILDEVAPSPLSPAIAPPDDLQLILPITGLATFSYCARLYYYQHVLEISPQLTVHAPGRQGEEEADGALLGSSVHGLLEKMPMGAGSKCLVGLEPMAADWLASFSAGVRQSALGDIDRAFTKAPLNLLSKVAQEDIYRETPIYMKIVDNKFSLVLTGQADLMWPEGDITKLVDYKYSEASHERSRYDFQLMLYAYGLITAGMARRVDGSIVYLKGKVEQVNTKIFLQSDMPEMKHDIVAVARELAWYNGQLEREWRLNERSICKKCHCFFENKCFPVS